MPKFFLSVVKHKNCGLLPEQLLCPFTLTSELKRLIQRLHFLIAESENVGAADKIDLVCFAILVELLFQRNLKNNAAQNKISKIASLIQMDAGNIPDIRKIVMENGFSLRSFYRQWKKVFPVSPIQYLTEQRMERASYLLTRSGMSIREIAMTLHFCDDNHFSNTFKRFYGMTPREYRKKTAAP